MQMVRYLRRKEAAVYLKEVFGFGSEKTLAKLASIGGGPSFCRAGTIVLYEPAELDKWASSRIGLPMRSTSDNPKAA